MAQQTKCRKKTEARREAILDAALEEFAAKGYAGARMEDIARRAGVAKGTLYLHFGDKEGLFNGLAESAFAPMHALAKEILDDKTPTLREKLLRFCGPMLDEQGCSRTARIIRLVWAEGLHNPKLVAPFYHGSSPRSSSCTGRTCASPRMSTRTRRSSGSRSFSSRRSCRGCSGKGCSRTRPRST